MSRAGWWLLISALVLGFAIRLYCGVFAAPQLTPWDDGDYLDRGLYFARGGVNDAWRAPMQIWFVGFVMRLTDHSYRTVRVVQALISCLVLVAAYPVAKRLAGAGAAAVVVAVMALWPEFWLYSAVLMSEPLCTLFILPAVLLTIRAAEDPLELPGARRFLTPLAAGALWGLTALTRDEFLYIAVAMVPLIWLFRGRRRNALLPALLLLAGLFMTVLPYTARNIVQRGSYALITDHGAFNLWEHWDRNTSPQQRGAEFFSWPEGERQRRASAKAVSALLAEPGFVLQQGVRSFFRMWVPDDLLLSAFFYGPYDVPKGLVLAQYWAVAVLVALLLTGYLAGATARPRSPAFWIVHTIVVLSVLMHALAYGQGRYRTPYTPLMMAVAVLGFRESAFLLQTRRKALLGALAGGVVLMGGTWVVLGGETAGLMRNFWNDSRAKSGENRLFPLMSRHFAGLAHISTQRKNQMDAYAGGRPAPPVIR